MADSSHLERMGIELKCPICLSLFNSAVSLTCNHVFCNLCIEKSMKSASSCPVCKVPYRRREVRPAPHMDNLVSIYKSMEVASGFNIFLTQNVPSTKLSDEEKQSEGGTICERQESGRTCEEITDNQRRSKGKRSFQSVNINQENSNLDPVKPSFPTKKRVQVPQYPPSDIPVPPASYDGGYKETPKVQPEKSAFLLKETSAVNVKGEPVFTPFFWLRDEEDGEKLTQQRDEDHNMDTPPNAPCFSDIKDSPDEIPSKVNPQGGTNIKFNDADCFDSEMFEWTQRPCSPELCLSPMRIQVADSDEFDGIQVKEGNVFPQGTVTAGKHGVENKDPKLSIDKVEVSVIAFSSPKTNNTNPKDGMENSNKRVRKVSERTIKKQGKRPSDYFLGVLVDSEKAAENISWEKKNRSDVDSLIRTQKGHKKVSFDTSAAERIPDNVSALSAGTNPLNLDKQTRVTDLPGLSDQQESSMKSIAWKQGNHPIRSKNATTTNSKKDRELRYSKKQKISTSDISKEKRLVNGGQDGCGEVFAKNTGPFRKYQHNSQDRELQDSAEMEKVLPASTGAVLHKCMTVPKKIECAFCHSSEDSEDSGDMVHYLNGKPVAADYNGGLKVIHAHRNCMEWAPNVYFEDDNAINLEAELARSRRIKCCCCDIKGAALGCYEKSCRKSFHVPCAKLITNCRWDIDNFVLLCPLHASAKLPNDIFGSQIRRNNKCIRKRPPKIHQPEVAVKHASNANQRWNSSGSCGKLVLCCSALSNEEKEIVSEFERLSGATLLKNWDSSVTHVIASTDENGACRRTLKVLKGISEGKWILTIEWIKACMKATKPVDELLYEIGVDVHGVRDGPRLGRLRVLNKEPKLFDGCKFYFTGEFVPSYKGYLHDLIIAAGGTVLQRKPISRDQESQSSGHPSSSTFIVCSLELPDKSDPNKRNLIFNQRRSDAEALASSAGAIATSNLWVLNSIAACKLQSL